ncbi:ATP-dependent sacrificial sulfur transferase LarE [Intestinimonas massiliensis (ex Afouda et al. 2020)]|uniref:ATP-dependent sacrificial sulfur transferase LarE n=1 Tax=Intestinimonas massiliensis (ex Afouda et al. 2020) TaxID=1673721 RepID=UPI0010326328|nr:ATP-dependent sacrificial sulfur transferase LarE [Intestinimonas massiliensis (ex Afouda et al. 2020)]
MTLKEFFDQNPRAAVAFSGGTDSALVLWAARQYGREVRAYYVHTVFQPAFELADAQKLAAELNVPLTVVEADVLAVPEAAANGPRRCYYCKKALFTNLWKRAAADGYSVLLDGTNASDDAGDRPGMQALKELEVRSPLRECGLTKDQVRQLSKEAGLFTWDKPAYACLATRVPTGTAITAEALAKVERSEAALFKLGFTDFRVRLLGDAARIQVPADQMERAAELHDEINRALKADFSAVLLDLAGR